MDEYAVRALLVDREAGEVERSRVLEELRAFDVRAWRDLDAALRRAWWAGWSGREERDREQRGPTDLLRMVVSASSPDGYARQRAVVWLAGTADPVALPALALRTGDWVPQVRAAARTAVAVRLTSVDALLGVGPIALLLAARGRGDWLRGRFDAAVSDATADDLRRLLATDDAQVRRAAFAVASREGRVDHRTMLNAALRDRDLVVRSRCAAVVIRAGRDTGRVDDLALLARSRTATIRADAVWALAAVGHAEAAVRALSDPSPPVRQIAQAAVRRTGDDPAVTYRSAVVAGGALPAAIAGLGECGERSDADTIARYLADGRPRARREAVRALRALGAGDAGRLSPLLDDPSPGVVRQVVTTLVHDIGIEDRVRDLLQPDQPAYVRAGAFRLRRDRGVWSRVLVDLEWWEDEQLGPLARADLMNWLGGDAATTYSVPSGEMRARLDLLVTQRELGRDTERRLRFFLGLPRTDTTATPTAGEQVGATAGRAATADEGIVSGAASSRRRRAPRWRRRRGASPPT